MRLLPALPLRRALTTVATLAIAASVAAGCGSDDDSSKDDASGSKASSDERTLVVYSGREKELAEPIYKSFTEETGIEVEARYADSAAMAAQLQEEGDRSPADVFYAQDAGAMGVVEEQLAVLDPALVAPVPAKLRDTEGRWTGVTARVRTLAYNVDQVEAAELPKTVEEVNDPKWKGKVGVAPTNASFIAFVSAMRLQEGDAAAKRFLEGLVANDAQIYEKNGPIVDAVGAGEVEIGLVNHYYLYERLEKDPDLPLENHYFASGDVGSYVNVSAVGILDGAEHAEEAQEFVKYLLGPGQELVANELAEREFPVVAGEVEGNTRYAELPELAPILAAQEVELSDLGAELEATVALIDEVGLGA